MLVNYSNQPVRSGEHSIFLAGPTPRKKEIESWRIEALQILKSLNFKGIVYVPERDFDDTTFDYNEQINWEIEALSKADAIVLWIPRKLPDMPAFTTNVEFGEWLKSGKIIYGRPTDSEKNRYLDLRYEMQTGIKPFDNLYSLLGETIKFVNDKEGVNNMEMSYELSKIMELVSAYPEIRHLVGDVQFTPESFGAEISGTSYGRILFPNAADNELKEFDRTILSVILYYYFKDNKYEEFTESQDPKTKLSKESFEELRTFIVSAIDTHEKENLLIYYLVINDLGKNGYMIRKLKELGIESVDHDVVLRQLIANNMLPSFNSFDVELKQSLFNILDNGINFGQFIQGESTDYSLEPLGNLSISEIEVMLVEAMLDIAGVLGHIEQKGSKVLNQPTAKNFLLGAKVLSNRGEFNDFLSLKAEEYGLGKYYDNYKRAVTRICLMLRINPDSFMETGKVVGILGNGCYADLIKELNETGFGDRQAILLYYSPALLNNARGFFNKEDPTNALENCLKNCLTFLQNVVRMIRSKTSPRNGVITVMLREAAMIASQNPRELSNIDLNSLTFEE